METDFAIVLVYLGDKLPKYVEKNMKYLHQVFPNIKKVLLTDSSETILKHQKLGFNLVRTRSFEELWQEFQVKSALPVDFRDGFWLKTIARFAAIAEFQREFSEPILYVESDVRLSPNFPFQNMQKIDNLAFTLETQKTGSAAVMWFPNPKSSDELVDFSIEELSDDPTNSDMTILGSFWRKRKPETFILPSTYNFKITDDSKPQYVKATSENFYLFNSLFDPLTIGLYLYGEDPRNNRGKTAYRKETPNHILKCAATDFRRSSTKDDIVYKTLDGFVLVNNLHLHSKKIHLFKRKISRPLLAWRSKQFYTFSPDIFIKMAYGSLLKRIQK